MSATDDPSDEDIERLVSLDERLKSTADMRTVDADLNKNFQHGLSALCRLRRKQSKSTSRLVTSIEFPTEPNARATNVPPRFGRFLIQQELGRGGFGVVFKAFDTVLSRHVALKVPKLENLEYLNNQIEHEGRTAAALEHPNIVPIYDAGKIGPVPFIAFAYCAGESLSSWLVRSSEYVNATIAANWLRQLAEAVAHAHSRNILHRDLKPGNVMLIPKEGSASSDPSEWVPKITDFGLAKLLEVNASRTSSGILKGTLAYMAPEQASGRKIDQRTDVYGLGAILFETLTKRPPFQGDSSAETINQICNDEVIAPRKLRAALPRDLETICLKCLEKEPSRRYQTAELLADDLRRFIGGEPIKAKPVSMIGHAWRWAIREPLAAGLLASLGISIAIAFMVVVSFWRLADQAADIARTEKDRIEVAHVRLASLQNESDEARTRAERLFQQSLSSVDRLTQLAFEQREQPRMHAFALKSIQEADQLYRSLLSIQPNEKSLRVQAANAARTLGAMQNSVGKSRLAVESFDRSEALYRLLSRDFPNDLAIQSAYAKLLSNYGYATTGNNSRDKLREAKSVLEKILRQDPSHVEAKRNLSNLLANFARRDFAVNQIEVARANATKSMSLARELMKSPHQNPDRIALAFAADALIKIAIKERHFARAHDLADEALSALNGSTFEDDRRWGMERIAFMWNMKAEIFQAEHKANESIRHREKALTAHLAYQDDFPDLGGPKNLVIQQYAKLAIAYVNQRRFEDAEESYRQIVTLAREATRNQNMTSSSLAGMIPILQEAGRTVCTALKSQQQTVQASRFELQVTAIIIEAHGRIVLRSMLNPKHD